MQSPRFTWYRRRNMMNYYSYKDQLYTERIALSARPKGSLNEGFLEAGSAGLSRQDPADSSSAVPVTPR